MASMSDTLATLVNAGIPVWMDKDASLQVPMNNPTHPPARNRLGPPRPRTNYSLGRSGLFPKLVISMIKIGEETGQLSFMLEKLAIFYKRELEATVSSLTKAMEPAVLFVVAGIVGTIVIALYLPMFSIITNMRG